VNTIKNTMVGKNRKNSGEKDNILINGFDDTIFTRKSSAGNCIISTIKSALPIITWLPQYNLSDAISDLIAGVTVGLTVIPQGIAYATIAGLEPQYGLYSAFMGCFVYMVFGSCKDITIGPTAIMALMTGIHAQYGADYAILLAFLSGLIILACGLLKLGFLIDFISMPVIAGFTSAAAITIATSQVKSLLGLTIPSDEKSHLHLGIIDPWIDVFTHIRSCRWQDALLGFVCCAILLSLRKLNRTNWLKPVTKDGTAKGCQAACNKLPATAFKIMGKFVWFVCTARNAIIVIFCLILAMIVDPKAIMCKDDPDNCVFTLTGSDMTPGLPSFTPPPFSTHANKTEVGFGGMVSQLGSAIFIIPLIAILESVAIAKAFSKGKPVDASQEMLALGFCNIAASFVQSMPITGSFSRTAVNCASGVKTALGGLYTGVLVILCLQFLMPACAFIPKATLAAVIITAVIFSVEHHIVKPVWNSKRADLIPGFACFFGCLFYELEMGIGFGVLIQILMILYHTARPHLEDEIRKVPGPGDQDKMYLSITPHAGVLFPAVTHVRAVITNKSINQDFPRIPVVIDCSHMYHLDYTAAAQFSDMMQEFSSRQQEIFWLSPNMRVSQTLKSVAGDMFIRISSPHQILEDQRDGTLKDNNLNVIEEEEPFDVQAQ